MLNRRVDGTGKDRSGDITSLCGRFGIVPKETAIRQTNNKTHRYYVQKVLPLVYVRVRYRNGRPYLTTDADAYSANNLDNLPDC